MDKLNKVFDRIFVLTILSFTDRIENMKQRLEEKNSLIELGSSSSICDQFTIAAIRFLMDFAIWGNGFVTVFWGELPRTEAHHHAASPIVM